MNTTTDASGKYRLICAALLACAALSYPAWGYENDGPDYDPTAPKRARMLASQSDTSFAPPEASDICFVATKGGDIGVEVWGNGSYSYREPRGSITIPLPINRYFGDKQKLIESEALPKTAKLTMVVWDVDNESSHTPAEYDEIFFNNNPPIDKKTLYGVNNGLKRNEFIINIDAINLPENPGETAENTIRIDVATKGGDWVTRIDWVALEIPAAPPVILSHGINSSADTLKALQQKIKDETGLPCETFDYPNHGNNHVSDIGALSKKISDMKSEWKVDHINIVAHSMGGLRAREYAENADDVLKVLQIATPNRGSPFADGVVKWCKQVWTQTYEMDEGLENVSKDVRDSIWACAEYGVNQIAEKVLGMKLHPWSDPAIECLQTSFMDSYNSRHRLNDRVEYGVVAGNVTENPRFPLFDGAVNVELAVDRNDKEAIDVAALWIAAGASAKFRVEFDKCISNVVVKLGLENYPNIGGVVSYYLSENLKKIINDLYNDSDWVVPVSSAHHIVPKLPGSELTGDYNEVWHSGLIRDGVGRVVACLKPKLVEKKTDADNTKNLSTTKNRSTGIRKSANFLAKASIAEEGADIVANSIQTGAAFSGKSTSASFGIVQGHHAMVILNISTDGIKSTALKLKAPSGKVYEDCAQNVYITNGISNAIVLLPNPEKGKWTLEWMSEFSNPANIGIWTLSAVEVDDGVVFSPKLANTSVEVGGSFALTVSPKVGTSAVSGAVKIVATSPDGTSKIYNATQETVGVFSAQIPATIEGHYTFAVTLDAASPSAFSRSSIISGVAYSGGAKFLETHSAEVLDVDANGLYDNLTVNFAVDATKSGAYRVLATLADTAGNEITEGWTSNIVCSVGTHMFPVAFDGRAIYGNGECGGYVVSSVKLLEIGDDYEAVIDERSDFFTTTAYTYRQFEHSLVEMLSGGNDTPMDTDGDGIYDKLDVTIPLYADDLVAGTYEWSASLENAEGSLLGTASGSMTFSLGTGGAPINMSFAGAGIAATDLDGPFYVKSLILWGNGRTFTISSEYATQPYSIKQWGGTPRHKPRYDFVEKTFSADEGEKLVVTIAGGDEEGPCSMQVYLTYNTAAAADLDLTKGSVGGVTPKGGLKFPLTVSWAAGETGAKTIEIPVKADTTFEADEFFTLQLANPAGMALGDFRVCTVTIHDRNTKATLADAINNQLLKPSTTGAGKWAVVESWATDPHETHCAAFAESPAGLLAGKTAALSLGTQKGAGTLTFDMKFVGEDVGGASFVEVYDGKTLLKTFTMSGNGTGWKTCQVYSSTSGSRALSIVLTQGADLTSRVRITNVVWKPSSSSSYTTIGIEVYPAGAGFASGAGTYANNTKVNFVATPRPGYTFVGWYRTSGSLFSSKAKLTVTMTGSADFIALFSKDPYVRGLADPAPAGKVAGSGLCASGKKVTLKATANKGFVFEGWYNERDVRLTQAASLLVDNSAKPAKPSATTYVISNCVSDVTYYARFVTVDQDKASISCAVGGMEFPAGSTKAFDAELPCGVRVDWPVVSAGLSQTTVKVAGLPAGLKYNTKTGSIEGAPNAPSKKNTKTGETIPSVVKITVTTAGKSTKDFLVNLKVAEMPSAAVGTFNGFVSLYDSDASKFYRAQSTASFTLTTTSAGNISAKTVSPKGTVSFSVNCWDELDDDTYSAFLVARTGEMLYLYVDSKPQYWNGSNQAYGFIKGGSFGSEWLYVEAQRSSFLKSGKDYEHPEAVVLAKAMQGAYKFDATYQGDGSYVLTKSDSRTAPLSVTIKNTGAVTVAGTLPGTTYKMSGSGTLRVYPPDGAVDMFVCGASGKTVNLMLMLRATLDADSGALEFDGAVYVNLMK